MADKIINYTAEEINNLLEQVDSDFYNKSEVDAKIHNHTNKSVLDGITQSKIDKWDNGGDSNFSGDYNDLINKPTIPVITNDLTNTLKSNYDNAYMHSQSNHFNGDYNNLSNKPVIPTVDVTKAYVDGELTKKAPISHDHSDLYYDKITVDNKIASAGSGGTVDLSSYQQKTDNTLTTTAKTVVGAINENKSSLDTITTRVANIENSGGGSGIVFRDVIEGEIFEISTAPTPTVSVTGVALNKSSTTVNTGSIDTLVATISPINATNKNVTWTSSNTGVATVSNGVVTGITNGTCTITCTTADGGFTATCSITVQTATISVASVSLNKSTTTIVNGSTEQLTATVLPSNATNKNVTWSSSNTGVATVSASGLVTGISVGSATITVTTADGNKVATCSVTIATSSIAVTSIALNKSTSTLTVPNTEQLTVTFTPSNATNQNVTWTSSDNTKATVSDSGLVTAIASGSVTVTATSQDGNKIATCSYTLNSTQSIDIPTNNLVLYAKSTDIIVGSKDLNDRTGKHTVNLSQTATATDKALGINSKYTTITVADSEDFNIENKDFSVGITFKLNTSVFDTHYIFCQEPIAENMTDTSFFVYVTYENKINTCLMAGGYRTLKPDTLLTNTTIEHSIIYQRISGVAELYLDGVKIGERVDASGTVYNSTQPLSFGSKLSNNGTDMNVKNMIYYTRGLSQSEITLIHDNLVGGVS